MKYMYKHKYIDKHNTHFFTGAVTMTVLGVVAVACGSLLVVALIIAALTFVIVR